MSATGGGRLASLDALRGITVAAMLLVNNPGDWGHVYAPLLHAPWHGCTPTDLIFPFFLFLVGVSMAFSVGPRAEEPARRPALTRGELIRALRILVAGVVLHLLAWWLLDLAHFRLWGVLQRIALCAAAAGLLAVYVRPRGQWIVLAMLLVGYGAALLAADTLEPWVNPVSRLDTAVFAPWIYQYQADTGVGHDPEGLVSSAGALATTVLGLVSGRLLRRRQLAALGALAASMLILGLAASPWLPFNKNLWTSSYACFTGGLAASALLVAHLLVDRRGWPALGRRFGVNAIAAYMGSSVMALLLAACGGWTILFGSMQHVLPSPMLASLACACLFVLFWWLLMWQLDARGIHLRI